MPLRTPFRLLIGFITISHLQSFITLLLLYTSRSRSRSHIATDGQSVSKSWCRAPLWGSWSDVFLLFDIYGLVFVGRPLWREDGSVFCICYWSFSAVFLGSESLGTRDHILLSQTRDFPFRRLRTLIHTKLLKSLQLFFTCELPVTVSCRELPRTSRVWLLPRTSRDGLLPRPEL
jgi:hypothetical protein